MPGYKYGELTWKIIGAAIEGHKEMKNGFQEVIYQRSLAIEMKKAGLQFERAYEMPVFYKEHIVGTRRVDFFVEGVVMVEIKALIGLEDVHLAQAKNYLEVYNLEVGLLLNFGSPSLQYRR